MKLLITGLFAIAAVAAAEVVSAIRQPLIPFQNPDRTPVHLGEKGSALTYVVFGDSTGAGQGADIHSGIAIKTAEYLAQNHRIELVNMSISGARAADVLNEQIPSSHSIKPDLVLISIGANDATHFTSSSTFAHQMDSIVNSLTSINPKVKIVVTGSPDMGSIPRFAQPLRWFAGTQGTRINNALAPIISQHKLINADIADTTGTAFRKDPTLFAADNFHPNDQGYAIWVQVLNKSLASALSQ